MDFSLVEGPIIWVVSILAPALVLVSLRPFRVRRLLLAGAIGLITLLLAIFGNNYATNSGLIVPALPWYSNLWFWAVIFSLVWAVVGWRSSRLWPRVASFGAIPATLLMTLVLVNSFFFYFPTFKSLFGSPGIHQASPAELAKIGIAARLRHPKSPVGTPGKVPTNGLTFQYDIPPKTSNFKTTPAWIYLPPAWFGPARSQLPVIELIGGTPSGPAEWLRGVQVDRFTDAFAAKHGGLAPVVVMIDDNGGLTADSECVDRPGAKAETFARIDVRRAMVNKFKVTSNPKHWAIAGLSEGGMCALNIAVRHPREFTVIGNFGGEPRPSLRSPQETLRTLFGGSRTKQHAYDPNRYLRKFRYPDKHIMFVIGSQDQGRRKAVEQAVLARRSGMHVRFRLVKGGHTFWVWRTAYAEFLPFAWKALSPPPVPGSVVSTTTLPTTPVDPSPPRGSAPGG